MPSCDCLLRPPHPDPLPRTRGRGRKKRLRAGERKAGAPASEKARACLRSSAPPRRERRRGRPRAKKARARLRSWASPRRERRRGRPRASAKGASRGVCERNERSPPSALRVAERGGRLLPLPSGERVGVRGQCRAATAFFGPLTPTLSPARGGEGGRSACERGRGKRERPRAKKRALASDLGHHRAARDGGGARERKSARSPPILGITAPGETAGAPASQRERGKPERPRAERAQPSLCPPGSGTRRPSSPSPLRGEGWGEGAMPSCDCLLRPPHPDPLPRTRGRGRKKRLRAGERKAGAPASEKARARLRSWASPRRERQRGRPRASAKGASRSARERNERSPPSALRGSGTRRPSSPSPLRGEGWGEGAMPSCDCLLRPPHPDPLPRTRGRGRKKRPRAGERKAGAPASEKARARLRSWAPPRRERRRGRPRASAKGASRSARERNERSPPSALRGVERGGRLLPLPSGERVGVRGQCRAATAFFGPLTPTLSPARGGEGGRSARERGRGKRERLRARKGRAGAPASGTRAALPLPSGERAGVGTVPAPRRSPSRPLSGARPPR
ncbi:MAG: hypothetical protein KatS3mg102_0927 [Planctomycetota bacterium]|nr:MAG: hypothetical protein KatS3mg102_0927 [Planctomycetota bacterium]